MSERSKILFPIDFADESQPGFATAWRLAQLYDADLVVMGIIEAPKGVAKMFSSFDETEARKHGLKLIDEHLKKEDVADAVYTKIIKVGPSSKMILEAASEIGARLIVMATHGAAGIKEFISGSVASHVIEHAPCPVLTIRQKPNHIGFKKIMIPIDLTLETGEKVDWGIRFASRFDSELMVLTILRSAEKEDHDRLQKRAAKAVAHIKSKGIKCENSMLVTKDNISDAVLKHADETGVDLICIMTQQESKVLKEYIRGAESSRVVNHSTIPVMSIKPTKEYKSAVFSGSHFG